MAIDTLEDAPETSEPATEEPEDTKPSGSEEGKPSETPPKFYQGRYSSLEEFERGHSNLVTFATKKADEARKLRDYATELEARLTTAPKTEEKPIDLLTEAAEGRGVQAVDQIVEAKLAQKEAQKQAKVTAWYQQRADAWANLLEHTPDAIRFQDSILDRAKAEPQRALESIVLQMMSESQQSRRTQPTEKKPENTAIDSNGRGGKLPAEARLSDAEMKIAAAFNISPKDYAKRKLEKL